MYYISALGHRPDLPDICFVETIVFTNQITKLGLENELRELQLELMKHPNAGAIDAGTGGLRKVRMRGSGQSSGKRGGARVHYLHFPAFRVIHLVSVYEKRDQALLTPRQKRMVKLVVEAIKQEWDTRSQDEKGTVR